MSLEKFIREMPKVELHVHLEGAIQPKTLLALAKRNNVALPATDPEGLRQWYQFTDFPHFVEIYLTLSQCIRNAADIELIAREFLRGQAAQNILYSEVTYTAYTHYQNYQIPFGEQLAALNRATRWAEETLGVSMRMVIDIARQVTPDEGMITAEWAIKGMNDGVVALGLGGPEVGNPPEKFQSAFDRAREAGLPAVPHAGETVGPESIWGALDNLQAQRIGHGVRCVEDPQLVAVLREQQIHLEVCPTSNLCLKVYPDMPSHPLPKMLAEGLNVSINSDDPPMFNTTLTDEYLRTAKTFGFDIPMMGKLVFNAVDAVLLPAADKDKLSEKMTGLFAELKHKYRDVTGGN